MVHGDFHAVSTHRFGFIIPIGTSCKRIAVSGSSWKLEIDYFDHLLFEPTSKAHQKQQPLDKHSKHTLFFVGLLTSGTVA